MGGELTLLSVSPSSGKSALISALATYLERQGTVTEPFKACRVIVPDEHDCVDSAFPRLELLSRSRLDQHNCPVWVEGRYASGNGLLRIGSEEVGMVRMLAPDSPCFSDLEPSQRNTVRGAVRRSFGIVGNRSAVVLVEGAGSCIEGPAEDDISNLYAASLSTGPIILSARWSRGGVIPAMFGTLALLPDDIRRRIVGYILTDVDDEQVVRRSIRSVCEELIPRWLGSIPHLPDPEPGAEWEQEEKSALQWLAAIEKLASETAMAEIIGNLTRA